MTLPKTLTTVTPFSKYLAMSLFVLFPFVGFFLGVNYQKSVDQKVIKEAMNSMERNNEPLNMPTTQEEPLLDDLVSYTAPEGWTKSSQYPLSAGSDPSTVIFLRSPNYATGEHIAYIVNGAEITIRRDPKTVSGSLRDEITSPKYNPYDNVTTPITPIKIDGIDGLNRFICGELSCRDSFFVEKDGFIWNFNYQCAPGCANQAETTSNKYAREMSKFIQSIKFK